MNLQEFAALKAGDKIINSMSKSTGEVSNTTPTGVYVVWGVRHSEERKFFYPALSTAWMNWTKGAEVA